MEDIGPSLTMPLEAHIDKGPFVYYIQCGMYVKIGTSIDRFNRVKQLAKGGKAKRPMIWVGDPQLLAVEFGNAFHERMRHHKFAQYRELGEWFFLTEELAAFIEGLQEAQTFLELELASYPSFDEMSPELRAGEYLALTRRKPRIDPEWVEEAMRFTRTA